MMKHWPELFNKTAGLELGYKYALAEKAALKVQVNPISKYIRAGVSIGF